MSTHHFMTDNAAAINDFRAKAQEFTAARQEVEEASEALSWELSQNLDRIQAVVNRVIDRLVSKAELKEGWGKSVFIPADLAWITAWDRGDTDPGFFIENFDDENLVVTINPKNAHLEYPENFRQTRSVTIPVFTLSLTDAIIESATIDQVEKVLALHQVRREEQVLQRRLELSRQSTAKIEGELAANAEAQEKLIRGDAPSPLDEYKK